jgi:hypothetical protein
MTRSASAVKSVRSPNLRKWILWIAALSHAFCVVSLFAEDTGCGDTLSVKLGDIGETHTHFVEASAEAREFIWLHWTERTCGELFLTAWSVEGVRTDSVHKVESIPGNTVVLNATLSRANDPSTPVLALAVPASGHIEAMRAESRSYQASTIERIEVRIPFIVQDAKTIPDATIIPSSQYRLRFRDKDGKVITAF